MYIYQVCIALNHSNPNLPAVVLSYRKEEDAVAARKLFHREMENKTDLVVECIDDFGYVVSIRPKDIFHLLQIDVAGAQICQHEKNMAVARAGKKLAQMVQSDPEQLELIKSMQPDQGSMRRPPGLIQ